jgi:hypothetical protein
MGSMSTRLYPLAHVLQPKILAGLSPLARGKEMASMNRELLSSMQLDRVAVAVVHKAGLRGDPRAG